MSASIELAAAFDRAFGDRLLKAERLVLSLPQLFPGLLLGCDLGYRASSRFFVAVARLAPRGDPAEAQARLAFWTARAGGLASSLTAMSERERALFDAGFEQCDLKARGVGPQLLSEAVGRMATRAGAPADRKLAAYPRPTLSMDAGGPGWEGVSYDASLRTLFVPGAAAPPVGDEVAVAVRLPGRDKPLQARARVSAVRKLEEASPGAPAGFMLALVGPPPDLEEALRRQAGAPSEQRAAPRYPLKAPLRVNASAAPATARIEYADERELEADYVQNLSQGGAFVRTASPLPVDTPLTLQLRLPGLVELTAPATVVFVGPSGMGVKFELDAAGKERLAAAIARISVRPRRALVVDDDALMRRMLADAMEERGFEVLTAGDGAEGLRAVAEEILTLDLLVTDVRMPAMDGEAFVRTIRREGGEADLAIVAVAGSLDAALDETMTRAGADAVLDKSLGPELLAQAADAALERRRLTRD